MASGVHSSGTALQHHRYTYQNTGKMSKTVYTNGFLLLFLRKLLNGIGVQNSLLCAEFADALEFRDLGNAHKHWLLAGLPRKGQDWNAL
eukprot:3156034-Amphidinium_carterae.1